MKILHLTLKKKWFDMIASGVKTEEYRELKHYWIRRLTVCSAPEEEPGDNKHVAVAIEFDLIAGHDPFTVFRNYRTDMVKFDAVKFRSGYNRYAPSMCFKVDEIGIDTGKLEWGAEPEEKYFVIKLGQRLTEI